MKHAANYLYSFKAVSDRFIASENDGIKGSDVWEQDQWPHNIITANFRRII